MGAIFKREISSFFNSAIAYITIAVLWGYSGFFFWYYCFMYNSASLANTFGNAMSIIVFLTPIITMKAFSEEKRQRTDQALLTSPASLFEIVMGKFLGAFTLYAICCSIFLIYGIVITFFTMPDWPVIISMTLGILLFGGALIAVDIFFSSLTESQVIAAIVSMAFGLLITFLDSIASQIKVEWISSAITKISFTATFTNFAYGLLDLTGIVYFLSVIALFIFLTIRVLEKKRWS